jgi:hypothetical protein
VPKQHCCWNVLITKARIQVIIWSGLMLQVTLCFYVLGLDRLELMMLKSSLFVRVMWHVCKCHHRRHGMFKD